MAFFSLVLNYLFAIFMKSNWKLSQTDTNQQILQWKYGKIIITKSEPLSQTLNIQNYQNTFLITTSPFKQNSNIPTLLIQSNQANKSFDTTQKIIQWFIQNKVNRNSSIFIKGGGMLLDLGSFAASIYMRGIKNVYMVPTTLLAMVDATVGGKNGINYQNTKNLIGTIRNPKNIFIHLPYLRTQSKRQFNNGLVETIKMAATYDEQFFNFLQKVNFQTLQSRQNQQILQKIIKRSVQMKVEVVQKDLTQENQRKWLNFGHTIGHGIELSQGNNLLHGECVAIGIIKACQIAQQKKILLHQGKDVLQRLRAILKKINVPTQIPQKIDLQQMIQIMLRDKKKSSSSKEQIDFVLIQKIGKRCKNPTKVEINLLNKLLVNNVQIKYPQKQEFALTINQDFKFPSSKSISLRIIYIQCLNYLKNKENRQINIIQNFLDCQDTRKMVNSLTQLGFLFDWKKEQKKIKINKFVQKQDGTLDVGNSGITTRFILPLCFMLKGKWIINCHQRMSERPNKEIIKLCLDNFKGEIQYLKKQFCFPLKVNSPGNQQGFKYVRVDGQESSQFVSSAIINSAFLNNQSKIVLTSQKMVSESYIKMTCKCLQKYGIKTSIDKQNSFINIQNMKLPSLIKQNDKDFNRIQIQKDLSTFSYPYIFNEFHSIPNEPIQDRYMQGDIQFYEYVRYISSNLDKKIIQFDFNNCTDTFMTLTVLVCSQKVQYSQIQRIKIFNIANQRIKQSNRIHLTIKNMKKIGVLIEQHENEIIIHTKMIKSLMNDKIVFETDGDHRLAMSFSILSSYLSTLHPNKRFLIGNQKAVQKTFPEFWNYLESTGILLKYSTEQKINKFQQNQVDFNKNTKSNILSITKKVLQESLILIGNRGSGKSTIANKIAKQKDYIFIDTDQVVTENIKQQYKLNSILQMVQKYGWNKFRELQSQTLQDVWVNKRRTAQKPLVISTGGGILQKPINQSTIFRQSKNVIYIERQFKDLKLQLSNHRPNIDNFQQISQKRQKIYQKAASLIINLSDPEHPDLQLTHVMNCLQKYQNKKAELNQGFILCLDEFPQSLTAEQQEVHTFQFRIDKLLSLQSSSENKANLLKSIRKKLSKFQMKHNKKSILTLRTKNELGQFQNNNQKYFQLMDEIRKIPTDFIDIQVSKYWQQNNVCKLLNLSNAIFSYHGNDEQIVKKLIDLPYGIKKYCYLNQNNQKSSINLYQKYKQAFMNGICIDLHNPLSRLKTKYQMTVINPPIMNKTGIMSLKQMKMLRNIF